jgi:hypothetical protein
MTKLHLVVSAAMVVTVARLVAYAINDRSRWRRFLFLVFLGLIVALGWWLLVDGGIHVLHSDFSPVGITHPQ